MTTGVTQASGISAVPGVAGGGVTSITFSSGLTGGTIATTGTVTIDPAQSVAYTVAQSDSISLAANTSGDGLVLINPVVAAAAAQRFSPRLRLTGQGWGTTAPASAPVDWTIENQPVQSTVPGCNLIFAVQLNGGGFTTRLTIAQNGNATLVGAFTANSVIAGNYTVNAATVGSNGINLPAANSLGFVSNSALRGSFDATGNFINLFPTSDQSKSVQVPTTGFTITGANTSKTLILNPAGTLATGTITMPAGPIDGQEFRFSSTQTVTALTVSPNAAQTLSNAPTTIAPGQGYGYIYHLATTNWFRLY